MGARAAREERKKKTSVKEALGRVSGTVLSKSLSGLLCVNQRLLTLTLFSTYATDPYCQRGGLEFTPLSLAFSLLSFFLILSLSFSFYLSNLSLLLSLLLLRFFFFFFFVFLLFPFSCTLSPSLDRCSATAKTDKNSSTHLHSRKRKKVVASSATTID